MSKDSDIKKIMSRYTYEQLKEMYQKDRKTIQDRLYKMGKTEFAQSKTFRKYKNKMPKVRELKTKEDMAAAFYDADRLIRSGFTTMERQRRQKALVLEGLHANNFDFVTEENYWDFYNFMEWYEDEKLKPVYGSPTDEALQTYLDQVARGADPEVIKRIFEDWQANGGMTKGSFSDYLEERL